MTTIEKMEKLIEDLEEIDTEPENSYEKDKVIDLMIERLKTMILVYGNDQPLSYQEIACDFISTLTMLTEEILKTTNPRAKVSLRVVDELRYEVFLEDRKAPKDW
jgi:hypothetical protein